jgi:hypothetical protein
MSTEELDLLLRYIDARIAVLAPRRSRGYDGTVRVTAGELRDQLQALVDQPAARESIDGEQGLIDIALQMLSTIERMELIIPEITDTIRKALEQARAALAADRLAQKPVPVSQQPWEREGWCDEKGQCWMGDPGGGEFVPSWRLCRPEDAPRLTMALPANAFQIDAFCS